MRRWAAKAQTRQQRGKQTKYRKGGRSATIQECMRPIGETQRDTTGLSRLTEPADLFDCRAGCCVRHVQAFVVARAQAFDRQAHNGHTRFNGTNLFDRSRPSSSVSNSIRDATPPARSCSALLLCAFAFSLNACCLLLWLRSWCFGRDETVFVCLLLARMRGGQSAKVAS